MKKKTTKKLVLAKETVRNLEESTVSKVVGGYTDAGWSCRICYEAPITDPLNSCYHC